jgi:hypothetical protein
MQHLVVTSASDDLSVDRLPSDIDPKGYDRWVEVVVSFDADFRKVITSHDGKQIRFVFMGRDAKTGKWQFFESGTGP